MRINYFNYIFTFLLIIITYFKLSELIFFLIFIEQTLLIFIISNFYLKFNLKNTYICDLYLILFDKYFV